MGSRFDLSWESLPHDGASAPAAISSSFDRVEYDELFRAWCQERHESVESRLFLDEALRLLKRLVADGEVTRQNRRRAKRLLLAIREAGLGERSDTI